MPSAPDRPIVCYVTDRSAGPPSASREPFFSDCIRKAVAAGVNWIQIREKDLPTRALLALTQEAVRIAKASQDCRILVNGRLDVAIAANANGLHLGGDAMPAQETIRWIKNGSGKGSIPADFQVGISCHNENEAKQAEANGADYIFFGPIFETPSKREFGEPQGIERLKKICGAAKIPVVAIGGITAENAPECLAAGAKGIAAIRLFQQAANPQPLRETIKQWSQ